MTPHEGQSVVVIAGRWDGEAGTIDKVMPRTVELWLPRIEATVTVRQTSLSLY